MTERPRVAQLQVSYAPAPALEQVLRQPDVLAVLGFAAGPTPPASPDPRYFQVGLAPLSGPVIEVWRGTGPVTHGRDDDGVQWASDGELLFGAVQIAEDPAGGIVPASQQIYRQLDAHLARHGYPHLLRVWNYLDAIVDGDGDQERYRQFCIGRANGIGAIDTRILPAATAIGRVDGVRTVQVYWLAARQPGRPLENPRQVSAYRYPRQYGPQPPSFARAMLPAAGQRLPLLLSGTASVVGHATLHAQCTTAQLQETFANFQALISTAQAQQPDLPAAFGAHSPLKVYLRDPAELAQVQQALATHLDAAVPRLILHAQVCRPDLRVEIDGAYGT